MAYEIADARGLGSDLTGELVVYIQTGPNPMTAEAWSTYTADAGWTLNTPRQSQFDVLNVLGSPYVGTGEFTYHDDSLGYRSAEHTSELQSLMRISYAVLC